MRCQGIKSAIALLLVTALFFGMSLNAPLAEADAPKVTLVDEGFFIEGSDIPDLSKTIKQKNIEKDFAATMWRIFDIIVKNYEWGQSSNGRTDDEIFLGLHVEACFPYIGYSSTENAIWMLGHDVKIGVAKSGDKNYVVYAWVDTSSKEASYILIKQQNGNVFAKQGNGTAKNAKDIILELVGTESENITYYEFDPVLASDYSNQEGKERIKE